MTNARKRALCTKIFVGDYIAHASLCLIYLTTRLSYTFNLKAKKIVRFIITKLSKYIAVAYFVSCLFYLMFILLLPYIFNINKISYLSLFIVSSLSVSIFHFLIVTGILLQQ